MPERWQTVGFALYVHWPFCEAKCPYCDFNSHVAETIDQTRWAQALATEIRRYGKETPDRILRSVFFGGGTPSLMAAETVATVLEAAQDTWTFSNGIEITLEANPRSVDAARFEGYARAGVNRVSLGVQALNDNDLKRLGRLHSAAEAQEAFGVARAVFDRVSFDLIYARQDQTAEAWDAELSRALDMAVDHLSLYQLTLEPGTAFWDRAQRGGLRGMPDDDRAADLYELTQARCATAGMPAYEVSNHARPGAESRHNLVYWRYGDWIGVGPGAHGRFDRDGARLATEAFKAPGRWLAAVESGRGEELRRALSAEDVAVEHLMMGLRLNEGIDIAELHKICGSIAQEDQVSELVEMGLLQRAGTHITTTALGRLLLNGVLDRLLP